MNFSSIYRQPFKTYFPCNGLSYNNCWEYYPIQRPFESFSVPEKNLESINRMGIELIIESSHN